MFFAFKLSISIAILCFVSHSRSCEVTHMGLVAVELCRSFLGRARTLRLRGNIYAGAAPEFVPETK